MSLSAKMRRAPLRAVTGAFILNSGLGKLKADEDTAKGIHGLATGTYGFVGKVDPKLFTKGLGAGEIALGAVVLAPFVSPVVAGLGVAGFGAGLLNLYWNTPGMHEPNDPRPTPQGVGIAKDIWMVGIGVGLIADGLLEPAHDKKLEVVAGRAGKKEGKQSRKQKKAAKKARAAAAAGALEAARSAGHDLSRRASKAADKAEKKARKNAKSAKKTAKKSSKRAKTSDAPALAAATSQRAIATIGEAVDQYAPVVADRVATAARTAKDAARDAVDQYGPVVADKAQQARETVADYASEYGPVVAEKVSTGARVARDYADEYAPVVVDKVTSGAKVARDAAKDYADEYGPIVVDKVSAGAKTARDAAQDAAEQARKAGSKARDRVAG